MKETKFGYLDGMEICVVEPGTVLNIDGVDCVIEGDHVAVLDEKVYMISKIYEMLKLNPKVRLGPINEKPEYNA